MKDLHELLDPGEDFPDPQWHLRAFFSGDCMSYVVWNSSKMEALFVDPKDEDHLSYRSMIEELEGYLWLAVIDTHTHADHVSWAFQLSQDIQAPLIMQADAPCTRVDLRVSRDTILPAHSSPIKIWLTPGHSPDSMTVSWGPFVFSGDTVLYGDTGRDDLPGGNPLAHYESLEKLKSQLEPHQIILFGHDCKGGRASSWKTQLRVNPSLSQARDLFVEESESFDAPAPKELKRSLRENFR